MFLCYTDTYSPLYPLDHTLRDTLFAELDQIREPPHGGFGAGFEIRAGGGGGGVGWAGARWCLLVGVRSSGRGRIGVGGDLDAGNNEWLDERLDGWGHLAGVRQDGAADAESRLGQVADHRIRVVFRVAAPRARVRLVEGPLQLGLDTAAAIPLVEGVLLSDGRRLQPAI